MCREQHAIPGFCQRADLVHHYPLISEIKTGRRLIEHDEARLLRPAESDTGLLQPEQDLTRLSRSL
jgi:hypothetical protein